MSDTVYLPALSAQIDTAVTQGYAVTANAAGTAVAPATTAAITASKTGTYDGIALQSGAVGKVVEIKRIGRVDAAYVPWLGTGSIEALVVDVNGKVWRASQSAGQVIGTVDKQGNAWIALPLGSLAYTTLYYQTVQGNGADMTQRAKLALEGGLVVADDSGGNRTRTSTGWYRHFLMGGG